VPPAVDTCWTAVCWESREADPAACGNAQVRPVSRDRFPGNPGDARDGFAPSGKESGWDAGKSDAQG